MIPRFLFLVCMATSVVAAQSAPLKKKPSAKSDQPTYVIAAHTVIHDDSTNSQLDNYVIVYGSEVLKVQYAESQISTVKPGASELEQVAPGKNLHWHTHYGRWPQEPDVSQVPQVGVPIRACEMDSKYPDNDGHPVIAIQSVSSPCMSRNGDTLHYSIAPNGGIKMFEYVNFDILEATNNVGVVAAPSQIKLPPGYEDAKPIAGPLAQPSAQSAPPRKDIPAIAKAANGAIVSIIMSDKDGKPISQGTGFLVSNDGVILTNYHVIAEGSSAVAKFPDGALYVIDGVLVSDKARDIAVIKAHGEDFRTLPLGNSDRVQVGEDVVAIGNPLSLESTVSNGIVSGIRAVQEEGGKYLQITAPISPGSSGGPLFNMAGEVIGITTMYLKGGENLNFAIPINDAKPLLSAYSTKLQAFPDEAVTVTTETKAGAEPDLMGMLRPAPAEHAATEDQCWADVQAAQEIHDVNKISYAQTGARALEMDGCSNRANAQYRSSGDMVSLGGAFAYESAVAFYRALEAERLRSYITRHNEWTQFLTEDAVAFAPITDAERAPVELAATPKQCWADSQAWLQKSETIQKLSYAGLVKRLAELGDCAAAASHDTQRIDNRPPLLRAYVYELMKSLYGEEIAWRLSVYIVKVQQGTQFLSEDAAGVR